MYYPDDKVEEVLRSNNIVDVVGTYVHLQKKGARLLISTLLRLSVCHPCVVNHNNTGNEKADGTTDNDATGKYQPTHNIPPFVRA